VWLLLFVVGQLISTALTLVSCLLSLLTSSWIYLRATARRMGGGRAAPRAVGTSGAEDGRRGARTDGATGGRRAGDARAAQRGDGREGGGRAAWRPTGRRGRGWRAADHTWAAPTRERAVGRRERRGALHVQRRRLLLLSFPSPRTASGSSTAEHILVSFSVSQEVLGRRERTSRRRSENPTYEAALKERPGDECEWASRSFGAARHLRVTAASPWPEATGHRRSVRADGERTGVPR
jgi:hypothetical protein